VARGSEPWNRSLAVGDDEEAQFDVPEAVRNSLKNGTL